MTIAGADPAVKSCVFSTSPKQKQTLLSDSKNTVGTESLSLLFLFRNSNFWSTASIVICFNIWEKKKQKKPQENNKTTAQLINQKHVGHPQQNHPQAPGKTRICTKKKKSAKKTAHQ